MQAQPNKVRLEARDEQKYKDKLLAKAKIIADSANRLWRKIPCSRRFFYCQMLNSVCPPEIEMQKDLEEE
jgi:hypothetical protein